ncbi:MAG: hypothetical protein J2P25_25380 [Nocardiopsaceae bacterium]|nr:hypothetical protein [Nocardiopsaceae bacterium]
MGKSNSFTLTAHGGPVTWSATPASGLSLSQTSGTLQAGQSTTITVTENSLVGVGQTITISPGGEAVTIAAGVGL